MAATLALVLFATGPMIDTALCGGEETTAIVHAQHADHASAPSGQKECGDAAHGHGLCSHGHCHHGSAGALLASVDLDPLRISSQAGFAHPGADPATHAVFRLERPPRV